MSAMNVEILAPAGSVDALTAAVRCGAAAVYLGAGEFNARRNAENFTEQQLKEAVRYCHVRGVKMYLTLNTLTRADEMCKAISLVKLACEMGVDALIVQDLGLARRIRAAAPEMPLHASTQLSCHTPDGVRFLRDNGFSRVVLAREMTLEEIRACAGLGCELEVFVHGALCMCVSGQCYLSAALGGRSGNRGLCAQPCRLPFSAERTGNRTGGYALSLKDQSLIQHIPDLIAAGVTSLKIEGRMKRPEYVAAATSACRQAMEGIAPSEQTIEKLEAVFSRSGFTDGYLTGNRGNAMFGIRRAEDVKAAAPVLKSCQQLYHKEIPLIPVTLSLSAATDRDTVLTATDRDGHTVTVTGPAALVAETAGTTEERAIAQLSKTGNTPFTATATASIAPGAMLPASLLNHLRREALEELEQQRGNVKPINFTDDKPAPVSAPRSPFGSSRVLRLSSMAQYSESLADYPVILPLSTAEEQWRLLEQNHRGGFGVEIPRGVFGGTEKLIPALTRAKQNGASFILCHNINAIPVAKQIGLPMVGGFGLHIMNPDAADFYFETGLSALTLSPELTFTQMKFSEQRPENFGVFAYGRLPLMLTRNCPVKAAGRDCRECGGKGVLTDRRQASFPVTCQNGCAELLNSVPHDLADCEEALPPIGFSLFHFTDETANEVRQVLSRYDRNEKSPNPFTRGLYRRGVE